ncbi:MAG: MmgE/PrpD family protein [Deltaproteobacteria bacterium]|nr:MmgE/PrpD family protein [Deltaproteobacteria bacterium]
MKPRGTASEAYASFCSTLDFDHLPEPVVERAKTALLDTIGAALAGMKTMEFPRRLARYLVDLGGRGEATTFTFPDKIPAVNAALANAAAAHALDMDDGHRFAALHPGAVVAPAALAAAEMVGADTRRLISGLICGYEVMIRVGLAVNPSSLNRGFHSTGVAGVFGSAAAAGHIMTLSSEAITGALGLAGLQSAGLLQVNHDAEGAKVKPLNAAKAAQSGLLAAVLAAGGAKGPLEIFEGTDALLRAVADDTFPDRLVEGLGERWEILNTYVKLYPACRHCHAAMDAALELLELGACLPRDIEHVRVETYPVAVRLAGIPQPTTVSAARFSIPFSLALALVCGRSGTNQYTETNLADPSIRRIMENVTLASSPRWEDAYPRQRGASVIVMDRTGRTHRAEVALAKGEPENPAGRDAIEAKFRENAALALSDENVDKLASVLTRLESLSLSALTDLL